ncbi:uncharacterized protein LOC143818621 isoform X1 [Ranitomeya variabilis]|uniref:uncharacterized protein LOC143818506 n=1 Tax=Ranitomeya variabilis TaxID=490064 RepID=UPI004057471D
MQVAEGPSVSCGETVASHITLHQTQNRSSYITEHIKHMPTLKIIIFLFFQSPAAAAHSQHREGSPSRSQSRRNRRRGRPSSTQRAPDADMDDSIDVDRLIEEVREREPLWNMADRRHADTHVTRRLWEEVCQNVLPRREDLHPQQQSTECGKVRKRWRSLRDRFKREFNLEMQAPSGSAGRRRTKYKYGPVLPQGNHAE